MKAKVELDDVVKRIRQARALLARVNSEVEIARNRMPRGASADLVDVNERLVVAAMENQDATDSAMQALEALARSAQLDPLTQLPNRAMMHDRIVQAISSAKRHSTCFAVLFIDVDKFKQINDTMGHAAGDQVLRTISDRLVATVRDVDTVSRHGGDEFVILLPEVERKADATHVADKVARATRAAMPVGERTLRLGISVGICLYPSDATDTDALIACADAAMYRAKFSDAT